IPACRLDLLDGPTLLAYPTNKEAYARLSALLTRGNLRAEKGECYLYKSDAYEHAKGLKFVVVPPSALSDNFDLDADFKHAVQEYKDMFGGDLYMGASRNYSGEDGKLIYRIHEMSVNLGLKMVATNDVHYHEPGRRELQDVLTCIREKCTIYNAGFRLHANAERFLKPMEEMVRLFRQYPDAITHTQEIAEACTFSLGELKYHYPREI